MTRKPNMNWIVSELYYPEDTSTGFFLTHIAQEVGRQLPVSVLCSQPTYSERGVLAPWRETHDGVQIYRCWGTRFDRRRVLGRMLNVLTISLSIFMHALRRFRAGDRVLVVTNPPLLPYCVALACWFRRARCILLVHDVYPEVLSAVGMTSKTSVVYRVVGAAARRLFRAVKTVVVLGRDMRELAAMKGRDDAIIIPNWGEVDAIFPIPRSEVRMRRELKLDDEFVVQYCGNMGRTHGMELLVDAASQLQGEAQFLMIGSGARYEWIKKQSIRLPNMVLVDRCPRDRLGEYLNACDVAVISFISGMSGVSVPSRMYNVMASGKPILAIADHDSELARVVEEERIGWVVPPGDVDAVVDVIRRAREMSGELEAMGRRARDAVVAKYTLREVTNKYVSVFS